MQFFKKNIGKLINKFFKIFNFRLIYNQDYIFNHSKFEKENIQISKEYSMTGERRMSYLTKSVKYIFENKIDGDFVECGVWKGGNLILMQRLLDYYGFKRKIYGYDTFEGMTDPSEHDLDYENNNAYRLLAQEKKVENVDQKNIWCYSGIESVKKNISKHTNISNLKLVKGDVLETLKYNENIPDKISLLRLDTDFYESTKMELEVLFPLVVKNGIIIIDDYGHWQGQKKAVDDFFLKNKIKPFLFEVDYSCRIYLKN